MNRSEYHALDAIGSTDLRNLARSPAHFKAGRSGVFEATAAMQFGTDVHTLVLEPARVESEWTIERIDRRTKAGKERDAEVAAAGLRLVDPEDYDVMRRMRDSLQAHPAARRLLEGATVEEPIVWDCEMTGLKCKALPDARKARIMVDLKTTDDASEEGFTRAIARYGYALQQAHYLDAPVGCDAFVFVAVEKEPPFAVGTYVIDLISLEKARHRRMSLLELYADCVNRGRWPAYADTIKTISLPAWAA